MARVQEYEKDTWNKNKNLGQVSQAYKFNSFLDKSELTIFSGVVFETLDSTLAWVK